MQFTDKAHETMHPPLHLLDVTYVEAVGLEERSPASQPLVGTLQGGNSG